MYKYVPAGEVISENNLNVKNLKGAIV